MDGPPLIARISRFFTCDEAKWVNMKSLAQRKLFIFYTCMPVIAQLQVRKAISILFVDRRDIYYRRCAPLPSRVVDASELIDEQTSLARSTYLSCALGNHTFMTSALGGEEEGGFPEKVK